MLLENKIKIKVSARSFEHYQKLGYKFNGKNDEIEISIEHLPTQSKQLVAVVCDVCGSGKTERKEVMYMNYLKNIANSGYYSCCQKCCVDKAKNTMLKNSGYEYANQSPEARQHLSDIHSELWKDHKYIEKMNNRFNK